MSTIRNLPSFPNGVLKYIAGVVASHYTFNQIFELLKNTGTYQVKRNDGGSKAQYLYRIFKDLNGSLLLQGPYEVAKIIEAFVDPTWWINNEDKRHEIMNKINNGLILMKIQLNESGKLFESQQLITHELKNIGGDQKIDLELLLGTPPFSAATKTQQPKPNTRQQTKLCFVLMPFQPNFDRLYRDHIKAVVENCGFECMRADDIYTPSNVLEDIVAHIKRSRVIIADVTGRNPNVFYEMGIAHTLEIPVIIITQNKDDVPFDIAQKRYFVYTDDSSGWNLLRKNIKLALGTLSI
jgi:hypothetical protein